MNDKIILLSNRTMIVNSIKSAAANISRGILREKYPLLYDLKAIRNSILLLKNTSQIRKAYSEFIQENSRPLAIILDYPLDLKLNELDPKKNKLLNTFLISDIILSRSKGFSWYKTNIILLGDRAKEHELNTICSTPLKYFPNLITKNQGVNSLVKYFIQNPGECKKIFHFYNVIIRDPNNIKEPIQELIKIISTLQNEKLRNAKEEHSRQMNVEAQKSKTPAKLIFKLNQERLYIDGKVYSIKPDDPKFQKYKEGVAYLSGAYTQETRDTVNQKISELFLKKMKLYKKVDKDTKIKIKFTKNSLIDNTSPVSLLELFTHTLGSFRNINLTMDSDNLKMLENMPAFRALSKYIIKNL